MTDNFNSERAYELYSKVFEEVGNVKPGNKGTSLYRDIMSQNETIEEKLFTPIEVYITMEGAKNKTLIKYIKGEINEFKP